MRSPVVIALGAWFDGEPREYRVATSRTAALRWLRSRGWSVKAAVPGLAAYAERSDTQEWARVIDAPLVGHKEGGDAPH